MATLDRALWRDIIQFLRQRHAPICRNWFDELEPVGLDRGLLRVLANGTLHTKYLQTKCIQQFTEAAQSVTGKLVAVQFVDRGGHPVVDGEKRNDRPKPTDGLESSRSGGALGSGAGSELVTMHRRPREGEGGLLIHDDEMVLSPDYSFDNFVTGPNNSMAFAASVAVANQPGTAYNPLFIHGGVGLGKTHLLQAICQVILDQDPDKHICYLSCDSFINHFIDCVKKGEMAEFRHRYRHVDVLVIDDIHFLANRDRTQEEFFHTFNDLYQSKRQIVLSSDSPPDEIPQLEERLISRFQWGLVTHVTRPDYETREAIIRAKAEMRGMSLPDDVVSFIAKQVDTNARELEGALNRVQAHALQNRTIDLPLACEVLGEPSRDSSQSQVTLQRIIRVVTEYFNVKLSDLQSKRRHKSITVPRQICMYLARKRTRFSLQEIGGYFGGRDHTTVMHSIRKMENCIREDATLRSDIESLDARIINSRGHKDGQGSAVAG